MNVRVYGITDGKKIQAIKGLRAATGLGLKEAKDIIDLVTAGSSQKVTLLSNDHDRELDEMGVKYEKVPLNVPLADFVDVLSYYPSDCTVAELRQILGATVKVGERQA